MSAYKPLLAADIKIVPFEVNKSFTFSEANALTGSDVSIDRFLGKNITNTLFNPNSDATTGNISTQYQRLIYNSIKELYYSNHLSSSYSDPNNTASLVPGRDEEGNRFVGTISSQGKYYNYNQSTLTFEKIFPTGSNEEIGVLSIPTRLFGNYIQPNSFIWNSNSDTVYDDGEGNLINQASGRICGNVFYGHGLVVLMNKAVINDVYGTAVYGVATYDTAPPLIIGSFITGSSLTVSFSSSLTIYESQYKCTLRENEFNYSLNPSIISGSTEGTVYDFVTGSNFAPFVTTIGLYDENKNLLAIGKLSQPIPTSATTDVSFILNLDR